MQIYWSLCYFKKEKNESVYCMFVGIKSNQIAFIEQLNDLNASYKLLK